MEIFSHPGYFLETHLNNVSKNSTWGYYHDLGKATKYFQSYIRGETKKKMPHADIGFLEAYCETNDITSYVIKNHHTSLDFNFVSIEKTLEKRIDKLLLDVHLKDTNIHRLVDEINDVIEEIKFDWSEKKKYNFETKLKTEFSKLIFADKMDAIFREQLDIKTANIDIELPNMSKEGINKIRNNFFKFLDGIEIPDRQIYVISAPTGIGKTYSVFNFAVRVMNKFNCKKIIYALPIITIIDQNEQALKKIIKNVDIASVHSLSKCKDDYDPFFYETFNSPITITTFNQIFYTLLGAKNKYLKNLTQFENSVIILDEFQGFSSKYWNLIKTEMERYNIRFIVTSATLPPIFQNQTIEHSFRMPDRYKIHDTNINSIDELIELKIKSRTAFVLNTINSAKELYKKLKEKYNNVFFLSSQIIPKHRKERINKIKESKECIVVSTQVIEAGVDISMEMVIRDEAPLDSIIQCAGRCNRNYEYNMGDVYVIHLKNNKNRKYSNIYNINEVYESNKIIKKNLLENELYTYINEYYKKAMKSINYTPLEFGKYELYDNYEKHSVFVAIDDYAEKLLDKYNEIKQLNGFERNRKLKQLRGDMAEYIIQIHGKGDRLEKIIGDYDVEIGYCGDKSILVF